MVLGEMAKKDVGIQKRNGQLSAHPPHNILRNCFFGFFAERFGADGRLCAFRNPSGPCDNTHGGNDAYLIVLYEKRDFIPGRDAQKTANRYGNRYLTLAGNTRRV